MVDWERFVINQGRVREFVNLPLQVTARVVLKGVISDLPPFFGRSFASAGKLSYAEQAESSTNPNFQPLGVSIK